jgi:ATP-dependent DNA ligase
MHFIRPAQPKLRTIPPQGDTWIHEIKFDGWRAQLHKQGRSVAIYTKNGHRCAHRVELIRQIVHHDGELTACYEYGLPNFHALHFHNGRTERCIWAFFERSLAGCREDQTRLGASPQYLVSLPGESR